MEKASVKSLKTLARCTNGNLVPNLKCISPFSFQRSSTCPFPNGNLIPVAGSVQGFSNRLDSHKTTTVVDGELLTKSVDP